MNYQKLEEITKGKTLPLTAENEIVVKKQNKSSGSSPSYSRDRGRKNEHCKLCKFSPQERASLLYRSGYSRRGSLSNARGSPPRARNSKITNRKEGGNRINVS